MFRDLQQKISGKSKENPVCHIIIILRIMTRRLIASKRTFDRQARPWNHLVLHGRLLRVAYTGPKTLSLIPNFINRRLPHLIFNLDIFALVLEVDPGVRVAPDQDREEQRAHACRHQHHEQALGKVGVNQVDCEGCLMPTSRTEALHSPGVPQAAFNASL